MRFQAQNGESRISCCPEALQKFVTRQGAHATDQKHTFESGKIPFTKVSECQLMIEDPLSVCHGGHGTEKTGNLVINFSRQGKHREFKYKGTICKFMCISGVL